MARFFALGLVLAVAATCSATLYDEEVRIVKELFAKDRDYLKTVRPPGKHKLNKYTLIALILT